MNIDEFNQMIKKVLQNNIDVTMSMHSDHVIWYDLNTKMKSDLRIALIDGVCVYQSRYDRGFILDFDQLLFQVSECICGRDFGNHHWFKLLADNGYKVADL